ncbi:class I SAM-dependent methyltransferase [Aeromicrobium sp. UC242_57]|uniref:class I SAM-dependent methyltransferase n=1 Tax=Aeromicrobium sp. UC242_57 TaxID=3374624 RepID=UPI003794C2BF
MDGGRSAEGDSLFVGTIPDVYESLLVPMIFQMAADGLAAIVAAHSPSDILETAAGTGVLTRVLVDLCPDARITATDLSPAMLAVAASRMPEDPRVTRRPADALDLPFASGTFDVVACQFGAMFFPDRVAGFREARRVLRPHGSFIFNVWDQIEHNEVPYVIESALNAADPVRPLTFMSRLPHGYFSTAQIRDDLERAGLTATTITEVDGSCRTTAADAAVAYCQGTPLRLDLERHETWTVADATALVERALLSHFGDGQFDAPIRSYEIVARPARREGAD